MQPRQLDEGCATRQDSKREKNHRSVGLVGVVGEGEVGGKLSLSGVPLGHGSVTFMILTEMAMEWYMPC